MADLSSNALDEWLDEVLHEPAPPLTPDLLPTVEAGVRAWLVQPRSSRQLLGLAEYASGFHGVFEQLIYDLLLSAWDRRPTGPLADDWNDQWWQDAVINYLPDGTRRDRLLRYAQSSKAN